MTVNAYLKIEQLLHFFRSTVKKTGINTLAQRPSKYGKYLLQPNVLENYEKKILNTAILR